MTLTPPSCLSTLFNDVMYFSIAYGAASFHNQVLRNPFYSQFRPQSYIFNPLASIVPLALCLLCCGEYKSIPEMQWWLAVAQFVIGFVVSNINFANKGLQTLTAAPSALVATFFTTRLFQLGQAALGPAGAFALPFAYLAIVPYAFQYIAVSCLASHMKNIYAAPRVFIERAVVAVFALGVMFACTAMNYPYGFLLVLAWMVYAELDTIHLHNIPKILHKLKLD